MELTLENIEDTFSQTDIPIKNLKRNVKVVGSIMKLVVFFTN